MRRTASQNRYRVDSGGNVSNAGGKIDTFRLHVDFIDVFGDASDGCGGAPEMGAETRLTAQSRAQPTGLPPAPHPDRRPFSPPHQAVAAARLCNFVARFPASRKARLPRASKADSSLLESLSVASLLAGVQDAVWSLL